MERGETAQQKMIESNERCRLARKRFGAQREMVIALA